MAHLFHRNPAATARSLKPLVALALTVLTLGLSSCGAFFQCEGKASCPSTSTTTSTSCTAAAATTSTSTLFGYAANSACGTNYLNGYILGAGTLASATNSPFNLGIVPQSIVITPGNTYMYIANDSSLTTGYIYGWTIGSGGSISVLNGGNPLATENAAALEISPDGKNLFALNSDGLTLDQFAIGSGGALSIVTGYSLVSASGGAIVPSALKFAPSDDFIVAALGTGGADIFQYSTTTGTLVSTSTTSIVPSGLISVATGAGINGVAVDLSNYIYASVSSASGGSLNVFSATAAGVPAQLNSYTTGNGPRTVVLTPTYSYVYVANFASSTISGFAVGTKGSLTAITGSAFNGPTDVLSVGVVSGGGYLLASGYDATNGIQLFTIGSGGVLTLAASTGSGTSTLYPSVIGLTH